MGLATRAAAATRAMTIGLFSRCLGCSSTFAAMTQFPEAFDGVRFWWGLGRSP